MNQALKLVEAGPFSLGEGIMWDGRLNRLYWIDINQGGLAVNDASGTHGHKLSGTPGTVVLTKDVNEVLLALDTGIVIFDLFSGRETKVIDFPENPKEMRFNDGKCDPQGRLWVGTMHREGKEGAGTLYRVDSDRKIHAVLEGVTVSNGICWSGDGKTMYFIDSATREIHAFDFDGEKGTISNRRTVVKVPEGWGFPDGMTIDSEDKLWVAHWLGECVVQYDPVTGESLQSIEIPTPRVTACWFGGADLKTLFITTAVGSQDGGWTDVKKYPKTGAVFACRVSAKGVKAGLFGGD